MNIKIPYESVDEYPESITAASIMIRMLDGLGYRFRYATEALTSEEYQFSPGQGCKTIGEIIEHVWELVNWVCHSIFGEKEVRQQDIASMRIQILELITKLRTYFETVDDAELPQIMIANLPFWHIINGPFSDALTHIGQIQTLRRLAGNLPVTSDVFRMRKP